MRYIVVSRKGALLDSIKGKIYIVKSIANRF